MNEIDDRIQEFYADQELGDDAMERLLAMERAAEAGSEAPVPPVPANNLRHYATLLVGLGAAALALTVVGIGSTATFMSSAPQIDVASGPLPLSQPVPRLDAPNDPATTEQLVILRGARRNDGTDLRDPWEDDAVADGTDDASGWKRPAGINMPRGGEDRNAGQTRTYPKPLPKLFSKDHDGPARRKTPDRAKNGAGDLQALGYVDTAKNRGPNLQLDGHSAVTAAVGDDDGDAVADLGVDRDGRFADLSRPGFFTPTQADPLSTFSVDVDTGSWSLTRRQLGDGYLPAANQVRPEEFVNAFPYDYAPPESGPFAVSTEIVPSPLTEGRHIVRIGLQGKRISVFDRKPVHLTFLVDVSGSMNGADRLPLVKQGLKMLVGELRDGDTVALVTYAGNTRVVLEPTSITDRTKILRAIDDLSSSGGTAMGAGIDLAYGLAQQTLEPGAINRVLLASDGDANVGERDADALARRLRAAADRGITLTTLGFGAGNYRDDVMERLADKGDGHYHYIGDEKDARRVLVDGLTGTLETIARDVKIQVQLDPAVVSEWRQIGYENRQIAHRDFRNDRVDAGEVGAGHQVTALYEVKLVDPTATAVLGDLRLRYEAPGAEGSPAVEQTMRITGAARESLNEASADTRTAVVAASFAERLRGRPGPSLETLARLLDLPGREEYAERDRELRQAIRQAYGLGLR